jgi:hypothetical protein
VHNAHVGFVAFFILIWLWFGLAVAKHYMCTSQGLQCA